MQVTHMSWTGDLRISLELVYNFMLTLDLLNPGRAKLEQPTDYDSML